MRRTTRFRRLMEAKEILVLPGAHDALAARIIEQAGFQALTAGGYSATATLLGQPDTGQLSMTEMADFYARLCDATSLPLFADADTGYGNVTNVARTVRAYERAGVAGLFVEDQVAPKRCGHMAGKAVIPAEEMVAKVKAALDARRDPDLVIMARTDALTVTGLDDAIARAQLYREAGADLIFVESPRGVAEMRRICREIDAPLMANNVEAGLTPILSAAELQKIGYAVVAFPVAATYAVARTLSELYAALRKDGTTVAYRRRMMTFDEFNARVGLPELRRQEAEKQDFARAVMGRAQKGTRKRRK
ncbi:MAG: isocitrate lyase/PEP mutase family protein [Alphaproteobacteria bacterium]|nr:isocitrate lyase/PEP mutase family protein [Alphaproteobacteria bacterium]